MDFESSLWRRIHDFLAEIGTAASQEELYQRTFEGIQRLIPWDTAAGVFDNRTGVLLAGAGLSDSAQEAYNAYFHGIQPWMTSEGIAKLAATWRVNWHEYDHSEFVTDFARPNGLGFALAELKSRWSCTLSLHRSRKVSEFSDRERDILAVVNPHVTNLYRLHDRLSRSSHPCQKEIAERFPRLSRREAEVLALLLDRLTASEVATYLFVSERTVESHVQSIYAKLDVHSRQQAFERVIFALSGVKGRTDRAP